MDFPLVNPYQHSAHSSRVAVYGGNDLHEKGPWYELEAALAYPAAGLVFKTGHLLSATLSTNTLALVDIGVGQAGSEVPLVSNLFLNFAGNTLRYCAIHQDFYVPIWLPKGARISARAQTSQSFASPAQGLYCSVAPLYGGGVPAFQASETLGAVEATTSATLISGSQNNPWTTTWAQLGGATGFSRPIKGVMVMSCLDAGTIANDFAFQLATGTAGNEKVVLQTHQKTCNSGNHPHIAPQIYPVDIPRGVRVAMRAYWGYTPYTRPALVVGFS